MTDGAGGRLADHPHLLCKFARPFVTVVRFFLHVALPGCNHGDHPELTTAHSDVLALFPGTSDWPFISSDAVSGPHKSLSFLWGFEDEDV